MNLIEKLLALALAVVVGLALATGGVVAGIALLVIVVIWGLS